MASKGAAVPASVGVAGSGDVRDVVVFDGFRTFPPRNVTVCTEDGARQSEAAECDINRIVMQYYKTGQLPVGSVEGVFADVSAIGDYRSAMERMKAAETAFMSLPPQVRLRFENDALRFVEFAVNPENRKEMEALGLLDKAAEVAAGSTTPPAAS